MGSSIKKDELRAELLDIYEGLSLYSVMRLVWIARHLKKTDAKNCA